MMASSRQRCTFACTATDSDVCLHFAMLANALDQLTMIAENDTMHWLLWQVASELRETSTCKCDYSCRQLSCEPAWHFGRSTGHDMLDCPYVTQVWSLPIVKHR
jgi:hypothetical protein